MQVGANVTRRIVLAASLVSIPWHYDTISLSRGVRCTNERPAKKGYYQILANAATLAYFLPVNAAQCLTHADGTTTIAYGGWASPYTDNYATNPVFTTQVSQGVPDRRAAGTSWKIAAAYTSSDQRFLLIASGAWYDYGNAIAAQRTTEWNLDGTYRFRYLGAGAYKGLQCGIATPFARTPTRSRRRVRRSSAASRTSSTTARCWNTISATERYLTKR